MRQYDDIISAYLPIYNLYLATTTTVIIIIIIIIIEVLRVVMSVPTDVGRYLYLYIIF